MDKNSHAPNMAEVDFENLESKTCIQRYKYEELKPLGKYLCSKFGFNKESQFCIAKNVGELNQFLLENQDHSFGQEPVFFIQRTENDHWATFCIVEFHQKTKVLFNSYAPNTNHKDLNENLSEIFNDNIDFICHPVDQTFSQDLECKCGLRSILCMEAMMKKLIANKESFILRFDQYVFYNEDDLSNMQADSKCSLVESMVNRELKGLHPNKTFIRDIKKIIDFVRKNKVKFGNGVVKYASVIKEECETLEDDSEYNLNHSKIDEAKDMFDLSGGKFQSDLKEINKILLTLIQNPETNNILGVFKIMFQLVMEVITHPGLEGICHKICSKFGLPYENVMELIRDQSFCKMPINKPKDCDVLVSTKDKTELMLEKIVREPRLKFLDEPSTGMQENMLYETDEDFRYVLETEDLPGQLKKSLDDLKDIAGLELNSLFIEINEHFEQWKFSTIEAVSEWANKFKGVLKNEDIPKALAVLMRAYYLVTGGDQINAKQILCVLILLSAKRNQGKICYMDTGEGKTTTESILAVIKVLKGEKVDVITTNLSFEDEKIKLLYAAFGITYSVNKASDTLNKSIAYYQADIIYGTIASFQHDYLKGSLDTYSTRSGRKFDSVIIDEIECLSFGDDSNNAKIYKCFPGMDSLKYVFIKIWQEVSKAEEKLSQNYVNEIIKKEEEIRHKSGLSEKERIDEYEFFKSGLFNSQTDELKRIILATNPAAIEVIPVHLKQYVQDMAEVWIDSALYAKYKCKNNEHYLIEELNGVEYIVSSKYQKLNLSNGLKQFLQLKHNLRLTNDKLIISSISNIAYLNLYNNIAGIAVSFGSIAERNLLSEFYKVDFIKIPTDRIQNFKEMKGIIVKDNQLINLVTTDSVRLASEGRSVLIISKNLRELQDLKENILAIKKLENIDVLDVRTFVDENSTDAVSVKNPEIILGTYASVKNINFTNSVDLENSGGLHVCKTFLPMSYRKEEDIFGKISRAGNNGTGRIILKESDVLEMGIEIHKYLTFHHIKKIRDEIEDYNIEIFKKERYVEISFRDEMFQKFSNLYRQFKRDQLGYLGSSYLEDDLLEYWAFWMQIKNYKFTTLETTDSSQEFENFKNDAKRILVDKLITHNPYHCIRMAEYFLNERMVEVAKNALSRAITLSNGDTDIFHSAYLKLFEVAVAEGGHMVEIFKGDSVNSSFVNEKKLENYKFFANFYLNKAKTALLKEMNYARKNFFDEFCMENAKPETLTRINLQGILLKFEDNDLLQQLSSRITTLNVFYQHIESLLLQINDILENDERQIAVITRIPYYLRKLNAKEPREKELKEAIGREEMSELESIGLDTLYTLKEVHEAPIQVINKAQIRMKEGLTCLTVGFIFFPAMATMAAISSVLISEGVSKVITKSISQWKPSFDEETYIRGKIISTAFDISTLCAAAGMQPADKWTKEIKATRGFLYIFRRCPMLKVALEKSAIQNDKLTKYFEKLGYINKIKEATKLWHSIGVPSLKLGVRKLGAEQIDVVKVVVLERVTKTGLEDMLMLLKPCIEEKVITTIADKIKTDFISALSNNELQIIVSEILRGRYGEMDVQILEEIALDLLGNLVRWKLTMENGMIDRFVSYDKISLYSEKVCLVVNHMLKSNRSGYSTDNFELYEKIGMIVIQVTKKIYELLVQILEKYARNYLEGPITKDVRNLDKGLEVTEEHDLDARNFNEIADAYETLGISPEVSKEEITRAYYDLAITHHPDKSKISSISNFQKLKEAYDILIEMYKYIPKDGKDFNSFSVTNRVINHTVIEANEGNSHTLNEEKRQDDAAVEQTSNSDSKNQENHCCNTFKEVSQFFKNQIIQTISFSIETAILFDGEKVKLTSY